MVSCSFLALVLAGLVAGPARSQETGPQVLTYSPWTKFCFNATCFTGRDGGSECGPEVAAVLIAADGEKKTILRVTLPPRLSRERGVRIIIDQDQPIERPYKLCFANGCAADYEAGAELIDRLKQGRTLDLEAFDKSGSAVSFSIPLADFANAYDGPPQQPKPFEQVLPPGMMRSQTERAKPADAAQCIPHR
jgi:invasion protein IalB